MDDVYDADTPTSETLETEVLVVGGSLVGLSAAMLLADRGVETVLVERHTGSHPHPRAIGYTARTLEIFAGVGLTLPEAPETFKLRRVRADTLAGRWLEDREWTPGPEKAVARPASPYRGAAIAQDTLEPMLRARARELGADLRLGTELVSFRQDGDGVSAHVRDARGEERSIRARYLIACDGNTSGIREALGIARRGRGHIRFVRSVLFRAPLDEYLARGVHQFEIEQPLLKAFLTTYNDGRWVLMFLDEVERDDGALREAIQLAIGRSDLPIEVLTTGTWDLGALVAEKFSEGRVFLAGDAAHTLPPTRGGFGANTGIHDVHNLAWKLAAVLSGTSKSKLLDTYSAEREPVAWTRLLQTFARPDYAREAAGIADGVEIIGDVALELGALYRSDGILGAPVDVPRAAHPDEWVGQPGTRVPYRTIEIDGRSRSTLDLVGRRWVLFTSGQAGAGDSAVHDALGIELSTVATDGALAAALGLTEGCASLVRPDGIIAWRGPAAGAGELIDVMRRAAFAVR